MRLAPRPPREPGAASTIMVPTMFRQMLALPEAERARLPVPTLRSVVHGGEPCPIRLKQQMIDWLGPIFIEYFGVSEGGMTLATTEEWLARPGTVGQSPRRGCGDDPRRCRPRAPARHRGQRVLRDAGPRPSVISGDPEKTAAAFRDSAFTAGDIGWVDDDGYLFISGRRRRRDRVGRRERLPRGDREPPSTGYRGVADLCVVSGPDEERGEVPVAVVVVAPGHDPATVIAALHARADDQIAAYERPRDAMVWDELPRDETGKLLRRRVRDAIWGDASPFAVGSGDAHTPT